ncbi:MULTISPECIES: acyl carrier protein [Micromonospora]|uniref:Acyl carrier protein n=1 Tax=Micromonospora yangpuensis TaxID=683228 RepID=A0A1C6UN68_9ACTN|nr:acyl carrier protein [Micromonospora yangpuensis]GGM09607.1 acyl carrier protein [Micromonospora yangpuensis]SCL55422.1 acyl carrier protein [Micromonospora yangpuensis]
MPAAQATILADLTEMINAVLGDFATDQAVTMDTTFRDDLGMESIDVVSLAGRLQTRYGDRVNFAHFVAKLDLETVGELRVGQLVEHIAGSLAEAEANGTGDEVGAGSR